LIDWIFSGAVAAYALASALLLAYLAGSNRRPAHAGAAVLATAFVLHLAHDVLRWRSYAVSPIGGVGPAFSLLGLLIVAGFLFVRRLRPKVEVVGAFITPVALLLLLASRAPTRETAVHGTWLAVHIGSNLIGMAAMSVAFAMAVAYLIQERQVKRRRLGTLFHRLPPLETLDNLSYRCLVLGVPALTVGVVTGHVVAARMHARGLPWQQYFAMISWALFAAVLVLRLVAGWRGRRAAIGTILGYASAVLVLLFYSVRGGVL
jgi:ABC-type uncharacterized transport system permease subunit